MTSTINIIFGVGMTILNLVPFITKKYNLLFLTGIVSLLMVFLLAGALV